MVRKVNDLKIAIYYRKMEKKYNKTHFQVQKDYLYYLYNIFKLK